MHETARASLTEDAYADAERTGRELSELDLHERAVGALHEAIRPGAGSPRPLG